MIAHRRASPGLRELVALRAVAPAVVLAAITLGATGCTAPAKFVRQLDKSHTDISRGIADFIDDVDGAFGESRVEDRERIVQLKVGARVTLRKNNAPEYAVPIAIRLPLPALERRANIFLRLDSVADASAGGGDAVSSLDRNKAFTATLLTKILDEVDTGMHLNLFWKGGAQTGVTPFLRWEWLPDHYRFYVEQQVYYLTDRKFGAQNIFELDRIFDKVSFLRLRNILDVNQVYPGMDVEHDLIYRRPFPLRGAAISAEIGATYNSFDGDPETQVRGAANDPDEAFARLRLTGTIFRPWIEYEITPGIYCPWRHQDNFEYGIMFTLRLAWAHALRGPGDP